MDPSASWDEILSGPVGSARMDLFSNSRGRATRLQRLTAIAAGLNRWHRAIGCQLCLARVHACKVVVEFKRFHHPSDSPKCAGLTESLSM